MSKRPTYYHVVRKPMEIILVSYISWAEPWKFIDQHSHSHSHSHSLSQGQASMFLVWRLTFSFNLNLIVWLPLLLPKSGLVITSQGGSQLTAAQMPGDFLGQHPCSVAHTYYSQRLLYWTFKKALSSDQKRQTRDKMNRSLCGTTGTGTYFFIHTYIIMEWIAAASVVVRRKWQLFPSPTHYKASQ